MTTDDDDRPEVRFGRAVREARELLGWTQAGLANHLSTLYSEGYSHSTVAKTEAGQRPVRIDEAMAYATLLRRDLSQMLRGPGPVTELTEQLRRIQSEIRDVEAQRRELTVRRAKLVTQAEETRIRIDYLENGGKSVADVLAEGRRFYSDEDGEDGVDRQEA